MTLKNVLMGLVFVLMWSSAFATARIIVASAPPLLSLALRFALSGFFAVVIALLLGQSWRLERAQARAVVIFGLCQNALYLGLNFIAMQWIQASLAALLASSMPLIVAALDWLIYKKRTSLMGLIGLSLGMAGVVLIMGVRMKGGADPLGIALCIIGALALAIATLSVRSASGTNNMLMVVGLQMLVGATVLGAISAIFETPAMTPSWSLLAAFLYQVFVPGLAATLIWFALVRDVGAVRAATFHFLTPFFGIVIAAILLGENIQPTDYIGVMIVMAGIWMVQRARSAQEQGATQREKRSQKAAVTLKKE